MVCSPFHDWPAFKRAKANGERGGAVTDLKEAFRMFDIFASCGAQTFVVTKTELEWPGHKKKKWGKTYSLDALREKLPGIVRTADITYPAHLPDGQQVMAGENVILRPIAADTAFIQLDDLKTQKQLDQVRPAACIIHETSPGNYQAWIAVSGLQEGKESFIEVMRRVRQAVGGNDKSASHATRLAGTQNWKVKYLPDPPEVTILEAHPGRIMAPAQLESLGLLAPVEQEAPILSAPRRVSPAQFRHRFEKVWPDYARSLAGAPPSLQGNGPDRSMADFTWCMTAIDWGWSIEDTAAQLVEVSEKARERARCGDEGYALITAQNAAAAVERNNRKRGRG